MNQYKITLGIEIHLELNTQTKMFSSTPIIFNGVPNTAVNENDLGYPGSLPTVNEIAVLKAIMMAKALNMKLDLLLRFDRKNYFYPDLPKGFQITQQSYPLGSAGFLKLIDGTKVLIERLHLEEDTAKSLHQDNLTLLDFNRAGNPLIEIVTTPCFNNSASVAQYIDWIKKLALSLNVSNAKMEEGSMRVDVNLSLSPLHTKLLGTKVEIKNLNSINNVVKAIEYEVKLQTKTLNDGLKVSQSTKRFDEKTQQTVTMRQKNNQIDYKYFPEPNIPPILINQNLLSQAVLPELPWDKRKKMLQQGIDKLFVDQLLNSQDKLVFFENVKVKNINEAAKIFFNEVVPLANKLNVLISDLKLTPTTFSEVVNAFLNRKISRQQVKDFLHKLNSNPKSFKDLLTKNKLHEIINEAKLNEIIKEIIEEHQVFINDNEDRPESILKLIIGKVMQKTEKKANPQLVTKIVKNVLKK